MSRGYSRGGGLSIVLAIIGTLIVVVVVVYILSRCTDVSIVPGETPTPIPTQVITATPSPTFISIMTPSPSPSPSGPLDPTAEPTATPTIAPSLESATVAVLSLRVRSGPGSTYDQVGSVKYKETYDVYAESGKWLKIQYNNTYGWIYGGTSGGDICVVRGSAPLPPRPTAKPKTCLMNGASISGTFLVTVTFSEGIYSDSAFATQLSADDFTVKEGGVTKTISSFTHVGGAGGTSLTFMVDSYSGGQLSISIGSNTAWGKTSGESGPGTKIIDATPTPT